MVPAEFAGNPRTAPAFDLGRQALEIVLESPLLDKTSASQRLYAFYRTLLTRELSDRFGTDGVLKQGLYGAPSYARITSLLGRPWRRTPAPSAAHTCWLYWNAEGRGGTLNGRPLVKVYLSPSLDDLEQCIHAALPIIGKSKALAVKMPGSVRDLVRPERLVVYFYGWDDLVETLHALRPILGGLRPHGVPFGGIVPGYPLIAVGRDRTDADRSSWRKWLCSVIATAAVTELPGAARQAAVTAALDKAQVRSDIWHEHDWPTAELTEVA
jgi:hypothetical protein